MIPSHFMALESWPLNANGKVDRKALPEPDWSQLSRKAYVAPGTSTQKTLAAIWSEVLGVNTIGIDDSFFELGGHSLTATQALAKAQEHFQVDIPLRQIFENPSIAAIAELIDQAIIENSVLGNHENASEDSETFIL
jgi:acyl carrier protein